MPSLQKVARFYYNPEGASKDACEVYVNSDVLTDAMIELFNRHEYIEFVTYRGILRTVVFDQYTIDRPKCIYKPSDEIPFRHMIKLYKILQYGISVRYRNLDRYYKDYLVKPVCPFVITCNVTFDEVNCAYAHCRYTDQEKRDNIDCDSYIEKYEIKEEHEYDYDYYYNDRNWWKIHINDYPPYRNASKH